MANLLIGISPLRQRPRRTLRLNFDCAQVSLYFVSFVASDAATASILNSSMIRKRTCSLALDTKNVFGLIYSVINQQ